MIIQYQSGW